MFLCAVARPRFCTTSNSWFDGKIGIWPVGDWVPAQRASCNCARGTLVWRNKNITREVYRDYLVNKLLPAIHQRWPLSGTSKIRIQQDGAKCHIPDDDPEFCDALDNSGLHETTIYTQAANSPDVNICDLGFFRAIQSANDEIAADERAMIENVEAAYWNYPHEQLNKTWLTLQSCFNGIIETLGSNNYYIPHMGKDALQRTGALPLVLDVTSAAERFLYPEEHSNLSMEDEEE
ncbi:hypothetical protein ACA910_007438 [Epithemia clementina (nom. ined.)]